MNFFAFFEYCTMWTYLFMSGIVEQISFVTDCAKENNIRVFGKWISLNSVNHDKIQKWYGYQRDITHLLTDTLPVLVM